MDDAMRERLRADRQTLAVKMAGALEGLCQASRNLYKRADQGRVGSNKEAQERFMAARGRVLALVAEIEAAAEARGREAALRCDCGRAMSAQCGVCDNDE